MSKLVKLSERLYYLPYEKPTDRPNLYYIKGDDYAVAVDAGNSQRHVEKFYEAIKEEGFDLPKYTIISHWHWDHTFGLKYINGKSMSTGLTKEKLKEVSTWKWTPELMKERELSKEDIPFCNECIRLEYPDLDEIEVVSTDIVIDSNTSLNLGGITVELMPRESTHSKDSLFVYLPSEKALIVEDADCEDFYNDNYYDPDALKKMIRFFESLDYQKHLLGHAEPEDKEEALKRLKAIIDL
ncbi:MAG: MBL fold metallo-hydrolase [Erysipelotrichaceae bacterium]|nr:MBL fold metallo-hydrolase [Erysipelotrichaceae bacterium]